LKFIIIIHGEKNRENEESTKLKTIKLIQLKIKRHNKAII